MNLIEKAGIILKSKQSIREIRSSNINIDIDSKASFYLKDFGIKSIS